MLQLQTLRDTRAIIRWMLACFVLSLGVAVTSPLVKTPAWTLVCSATGSMLVATGQGDGQTDTPGKLDAGHTLDCVLCLAASAPPMASVALPLAQAQAHARPQTVVELPTWRTSAPTSARDPPLFS